MTTGELALALKRRLAELSSVARRAVLADLTPGELEALAYEWAFWGRLDQIPPPGRLWRVWLLLGGRGSGKTRSANEGIRAGVETGERRLIGIVGPTSDAVRQIQVEGPSGLLAVCPPGNKPSFEPSTRRVVWPNGAVARLFSSEEPDRLRGPNFDMLWIDELCSMPNAAAVWDMAQMALRVPGPLGHPPVAIITTTPKPMKLLREIMASPSTVTTRSKTSDNAANLDASTLAYYVDKYGGTRLGRQELDAEVLLDFEGALWSASLIEACRISRDAQPTRYMRIVVAIDPPGGSSKANAECGIVVAGRGMDGQGYVLADLSGHMSPEQWARIAVNAYKGWKADRIVAEQNYGGAMVESTIRAVDHSVPVKMVVASRGKQLRAEPIAALYEQRRVHHVGEFPGLEDQMCSWCPTDAGPSPDRVDALVWCVTELSGRAPMRISQEALQRMAWPGFGNEAPWV